MVVERGAQPLDRSDEVDVLRDGCPVDTDQIDLGVELPVPPAPDGMDVEPGQVAGRAGEFE